jgi:ligand-binding SRPBCC domain-containing protein
MSFFVDEQRSEPYTLWHHQYHITENEQGVIMTDVVHYIPPFSFLGRIANYLFIEKQLKEIFNFRQLAIEQEFQKK